jgi:hypothetical protein
MPEKRPGREIRKTDYEKAVISARRRGKDWGLDEEMWTELISNPCYYCGGPLGKRGIRLDRMDSRKGYVIGNVVPCCFRCNMIKGRFLTPEQMRKVAVVMG